jgi:hypothetical protein
LRRRRRRVTLDGMHRQVFWKTVQEPGFEHLSLTVDARGVRADGVVLGVFGDPPEPFRLRYGVACDPRFAVRTVTAAVEHPFERRVALRASESDEWHDADSGARFLHLDGCTAVDVMTTPFTNTLPIRMLSWAPGDARELDVAYVTVPELRVTRDRQRYACLAQHREGSRFRVESLDDGWAYDVHVDREGLVIDYADLFVRVASFGATPEPP